MRLLCLLLLAASCTDFDDVQRGVCGNGLLEPGEDCDESDPRCVRCAVSCAIDEDCPPNGNYACGVDGFCHAPSGELARPTPPVTFQADDLRITDVDHDGRGDVIGVSHTSIVVRYGDAAGALSTSESFVTPAQTGPASFGDLDGDGTLDVTLSTSEGLVTFTSPYGALSPLDVEMPLRDGMTGDPIDILAVHSIGELQFVAFGVADGFIIVLVFDFADEEKSAAAVPCVARLGAIPRANFSIDRIDLVRAHADGADVKNAVVSFSTNTGGACAMSIHGSTADGYTIQDISPTGIGAIAKKPILVDLDGDADACPGMLSSDGGPGAMKWWDGRMSSTTPSRCILDAAGPAGAPLPVMQGAPPNAVAIGRIPIKPRIAFMSTDGIVMSNGLYSIFLGGMYQMHRSSRELARVAYGDLDGDGDIDGVATAATEDDIDILYRYDEGVELLRFDTAARVTHIKVGDYDGNGVGDLAYTEAAINHQKMFVAYGTFDRHLPPLQVAAFADVASMTHFEFQDSTDSLSVADDMLVIQPAVGNGVGSATLLHGSPQRTMLSFLEPRLAPNRDMSVVRGSVVGEFGGSAHQDLMAIAAPYPNQQSLGIRAYEVAGAETGLSTTQSLGTVIDGLADCQLGSTNGACLHNSAYLAWPRAGGDAVIAIDRRFPPQAMLVDPGQSARAIAPLVAGLPQGAIVQSLHAYDVDGDGTRELVAAFTGSVRVCDVAADGMPTKCDDIASAIGSSTLSCIDAAPGLVGQRGLVVLCREGTTASLFRVTKQGGAYSSTELAQGVGLRSLRVEDVTGDGIDDVVAVQGDGSASALVVFPQCTTRDKAACRANKEAGQ